MFTNEYLKNLVIFDIETVPLYNSSNEFYTANPLLAKLWTKKAIQRGSLDDKDYTEEEEDQALINNAGLHPEFSKIVSISFAFIKFEDDKPVIQTINLYNDGDEKEFLIKVSEMFVKIHGSRIITKPVLCGHNILKFDIPFLCKRFLINGIAIPNLLDFIGKKPWEINILDTIKFWEFTGHEQISLDLLCCVFGIDSPKTQMTGTSVQELYSKNLKKEIIEYNNSDVHVLAQLIIKLSQIQ